MNDQYHNDFFRESAIVAHQKRRFGTVLFVQTSQVKIAAVLAGISLVTLAMLLALVSWPRRAAVRGVVVPDRGLISLSAPVGSVVDEWLVQEGDKIESGDILLRYRPLASTAEAHHPEAILARSRRDERDRLRSYLGGLTSVYQKQREALERQRDAKKKQVHSAGLAVEAASLALTKRQKIHQDLQRLADLHIVAAHQQEVNAAELAERTQQVRLAEADRDELQADIAAIEVEFKRMVAQEADERMRLEQSLASADNELLAIGNDGTNTIRSPVTGVVSSLLGFDGQQVGQRVSISILPLGSTLVAELHIPSASISYAEVGQEVVIKLDAYPYLLFGTRRAALTTISGSAVLGPTLSSELSGTDYFFRGQAHFRDPGGHDGRVRLSPGMRFTAEMIESRQPLYKLMLAPLFR